MTNRRFFSAASEAQAVLDAANALDVPPAELAYRRLEKKQGFLRGPRVVIEVDTEAPRRSPTAAAASAAPPTVRPAPRAAQPPERRPAPAERDQERAEEDDLRPTSPIEPFVAARGVEGAERAAHALTALVAARWTAGVTSAEGDEGEEIRVDLGGAEAGALHEHDGELLRAAEYLLRRMVRDLPPGGLLADSDGFRAAQTEALRRRAAEAAVAVARTGEPYLFEPLPADERRLVHLAVQACDGVESASEGEGNLRRVRIRPAGAGG